MLLVQADIINGVCEVLDAFDDGYTLVDEGDFAMMLNDDTPICAALSDPETIDYIDRIFGIHRVQA